MADKDLEMAAALADKSTLHPFDGRDVLATTIAVTGAGDGLSKAMKIEPREFHHGEKLYVVLECEVAKVSFAPLAEGTKELQRLHTLRAGNATIVDADLVKQAVDATAERIQAAIDAAKGKVNLDGEPGWLSDSGGDGVADEDEEALVLRRNHMQGNHADGLMEGCPVCTEEQRLADEEAAEDAAEAGAGSGDGDLD